MYPGLLTSRTQTLKTFCMWSSNGNFYDKIILFIMSVNKCYIQSNSIAFVLIISVMLKVANDMIISIKKEGGALVHKMIFEK